MNPLRKIITLAGVGLPSAMIAALVLIVLADVLARNLFATSISWAQEMAVILLIGSVWLGLAGASLQGQMVGVSILTDRLSPRNRRVIETAADLCVIAIAAATSHAAHAQMATARFTKFLALGWPKWILAAFLAVGMGLVILARVVDIATRLKERRP